MDGERVLEAHWFKELVSKHRKLALKAASEGLFVCVPQTCSLASWTVSAKDVEHHILAPSPTSRGEFKTISGRTVTISGNQATTGVGFRTQTVANILGSQSVPVELPGDGEKKQGKLQIYFISRPLEGGIAAPGSIDELQPENIRKYLAFLRTSPDTEGCFSQLDDGIADIKQSLLNGTPSDDSSKRAEAAAKDISELCEYIADEILSTDTFADEPDDSYDRARQQVLQSLESSVTERLHDALIDLLRTELKDDVAALDQAMSESVAAEKTAADFGIKHSFRCDFTEAVKCLAQLPTKTTPLQKLHCIRDAALLIRKLVEMHLEANKVDLADVDLGADDELPMMAWIIHQLHASTASAASPPPAGTSCSGPACELPLHFAFITRFHLPGCGELEKSILGYRLANMEQALNWFRTAQAE